MGFRFIQAVSRRFKNRTDAAHEAEYSGSRLAFVQQSNSDTIYRFKCPEVNPTRGTPIAFADIGQPRVRVIQDHKLIGEVDDVGSAELRALFTKHPAFNQVVPGIVTSPKTVSGFARGKLDWMRS